MIRRCTLLIRGWLLLIFSYSDCLFGNWWNSFLTEQLISRLLTFFLLIEDMDRDRIRTQARWLSFFFRFCFQSIVFPIHPLMHSFDHRLTTVYLFPILIFFIWKLMKKSLTENLISSRWKKCALLKESYDRDGIRTHARRPYWISSPTP